jgi:ABC-2 type transport system permease protein
MTTVAQRLPTQSGRPEIHRTNIARQSWIMVKRNMIHTKRMPELLSDATAQPIMFVLLFAFVFGASITTTNGTQTVLG